MTDTALAPGTLSSTGPGADGVLTLNRDAGVLPPLGGGPLEETIEHKREGARFGIARMLLSLFGIVVLALLGGVVSGQVDAPTLKDASAAFITPLVGLVGAVTGYYYGSGAADGISRAD